MRLPANRRDFLRLTGAAALVSAGVSSAGTAMGRSQQSVSAQTTASDWQQVTKLAASDGESDDFFGGSVEIDGDTALIGADNDDNPNGDNAGSAYVYRRSNGKWSLEEKLAASGGDSYDYFGESVGIDRDTALVGAQRDEDPNGDDTGSAYVFRRSNGSWSEEAKLTASDGESADSFGTSVGIDGDTALIGASRDDNPNGNDAGSAYVFGWSNGSWSQEQKLTANNGDGDDYFGWSVGIDGDTALIGAWGDEDPNGDDAGSAYVFRRSNGSWSLEEKLAASNGDVGDFFGLSVGIDGDTALIGASGDEDPNRDDAGSAYVFGRSNGGWSEEAKLAASDGDDRDYFGASVGIDGDTALIGAYEDEDPNGDNAGSAYVFTGGGSSSGPSFGETGTVSPGQPDSSTWGVVELDRTYTEPVVVMQPVSYEGADPVHVRLRNVQEGSFEFQLEEWGYDDGGHTTETIAYTVMEEGVHVLPDGTTIEAGTVSTDHTFGSVAFSQEFSTTPVVLSQAQTHNGSQPIVTRQRDVSPGGLEVKVQESEANGTHVTERVGYVAIDPATGSAGGVKYEAATTPDTLTDEWQQVIFAQDYSSPPLFMAGLQTSDGPDTAGLRYDQLGGGSVTLKVEEETSANGETNHTTESAGYLTFETPTTLHAAEPTAIGENGQTTVSQSGTSEWHTVNLDNSYQDPVVVMQPASANGGQPVHVRIRNVQSGSFEFQLEEWGYLDGAHTSETVSYTVMETGQHTLPDGTTVGAGTVRTDEGFANVGFTQNFATAPVVLTQAQTRNGNQAIVTRQQGISSGGFDVRVQEAEAKGTHVTERVGYIAIEAGTGTFNGIDFEAGRTADVVTHNWQQVSFGGSYDGSILFLAGMQTFDGPDTAGLRYQNLGGSGVDVRVEEEQSANNETRHTDEVVGYLVIDDEGVINAA